MKQKQASRIWLASLAATLAACAASSASADEPSDPLLDLFIRKGFVTQAEAEKVKAEADALRTNSPAVHQSSLTLSKALKSVELFGDLRLRYEYRSAQDPEGGEIDLERLRAAARFGLRGQLFDHIYYGTRLDMAANPRSPWVTLGSSSSGNPYQGPFGKSTDGLYVGQVYLGWKPASWFELTLGKMPQPLYTTSMVWDTDLNPEGAAEHLNYAIGPATVFANFGQFIYQDTNPNSASGGLGFNGLTGQSTDNIFMFAWQAGIQYNFTTNVSAKAAATIYRYAGLQRSSTLSGTTTSPYFGDPYVGEGAYLGPGTGTKNGFAGYGSSSALPGNGSLGYPNNQVGLNNLFVLEIPFEINFKFKRFDARVFGDLAYNLDGGPRAEAAAAAYQVFLANQSTPATISGFAPQKQDVKAYQIGFSIASPDNLGMVYGSSARKHGWEARAYWQHIEQYALDPNILDSDFFEGRANMEGVYAALAYGLTDNLIGTFRYGYATRINDKLGTGGNNQDIPQINPVKQYNLMQVDLTMKF